MSDPELARRRAVVYGCAGPTLGAEERAFFRAARPLGFILFGRNCRAPEQVRRLVDALRDAVEDADAPILIDQEGGRVQRLGPPHWRRRPPARLFGYLARADPAAGAAAARLAARLIAADLAGLGITVNCAPVLDLPVAGSHGVIGDRAFAADGATVAALGRAFCTGLLEGGVLPVIKHIPGHGRARVDSHLELPRVGEPVAALASDFAPFAALNDMPLAMTAHVLYQALDAANPATLSAAVIAGTLRGRIGFDGMLVSDDISMNALSGAVPSRAARALAAGCDVVLHGNGEMAEMTSIADAVGTLAAPAAARWRAAAARRRPPRDFDAEAAERSLLALTGTRIEQADGP